jgi:hypothetical protein
MTKELELKLVEQFPDILKDYGGDKKKTCMHWGFDHRDGWFTLVESLLVNITEYCNGFHEDERPRVIAQQIKQKFGTLCFYYRTENATEEQKAEIRSIVNAAEDKSANVCEMTGEPGEECQNKDTGYTRTLALDAAKQLNYEPVNRPTPTLEEKVRVYEQFLHAINLGVTTCDHDRVKQLVENADRWSYAHRVGNGELSEKEQQNVINGAFWRLCS